MNADVILPAAGCGERFASTLPKQFVEVCGKPILCYTIEAFTCLSWIKNVFVVVSEDWKTFTEQLMQRYNFNKVQLVVGKNTRHRSIECGLKALLQSRDDATDIVIIHDAVRPFLTEDFAKEICTAAISHKAAGAVRKLVSTIVKASEDSFLECSLVRSEYRESHTPQAFQIEILKQAYEKCSEYDFSYGTECLNLVMKYCDVIPKLVDGPEYLWKVTYPKDIMLMENYLKNNSATNQNSN